MIETTKKLPRRSDLFGARVAVVDGDKAFLSTIATLMRAEGMKVMTFSRSSDAYDAFRGQLPQALVLSRELMGPTGMQILEQVRRVSDVPVLITSTSEEEIDEAMAFRLGADDYIRKPLRERALVERVRAKLRRTQRSAPVIEHLPANAPCIVEFGPIRIDEAKAEFSYKGVTIRATVGELRIMTCLMRHPGIVRSREALMEQMPNGGSKANDLIVASHVKRLRQKLRAVDPECDPIATHYGLGYAMNLSLAS